MTLRLKPELKSAVDAWAKKRGVTRAEAIHRLLDQALSQEATLKELVERGADVQRMLDRAEQLEKKAK